MSPVSAPALPAGRPLRPGILNTTATINPRRQRRATETYHA
jgi:hypothetical protein